MHPKCKNTNYNVVRSRWSRVNFTNILHAAFTQVSCAQLCCAYILGLNFTGGRLLAQKLPLRTLVKLTPVFQLIQKSTWINQSFWSSATHLLFTMVLRTAPTSTLTSFIGSKWKRALSASVSMAFALKMLSRSQTRIQPSWPFAWGYNKLKLPEN